MWHILPMCIGAIISPTLATVQSDDPELQWPGLSSVDSKSPQIDPDTAASVRGITVAGSFYTLTVGRWTQPGESSHCCRDDRLQQVSPLE